MAVVEFDTSEMKRLIVKLERVPVRTHDRMLRVVRESRRELRDLWRANARAEDLPHGKRYPSAITDEGADFGMAGVVGPESARPQGGMGRGFEFGSQNQKPHLEGNRAADVVFPKFERKVGSEAEDSFREI